MARSVSAIVTVVDELVNLLNNDLYLGAIPSTITDDICFDCTLWNNGYLDPDNSGQYLIPPVKTTVLDILDEIIAFLGTELINPAIVDYGFKTQIERLITMITDIRNKVNSIQCIDTCSDLPLISQLLATLVMTITDVITTLELLNGLLAYLDTCGCVGSKLFEILMGKFINSITGLNCVIQDWYALVMAFFQANAIVAKPYVAAYVPNQAVPMPQPPSNMSFACVPCPPKPPQPCPPSYGCNQSNCVPFSPFC